MRRGNNPALVYEDSKVVGVSLGSDFTSEHEWGIDVIKTEFGISKQEDVFGLAKRKTSRVPSGFVWIDATDGRKGFGLLSSYWIKSEDYNKHIAQYAELKAWDKETTLSAAWDEKGFVVISSDSKQIAGLRLIFDAVSKKDGIIMLGGGKRLTFANSGLLVGIASAMPKELLVSWDKADRDYFTLRKDVEATGIEALLKEKSKSYYALSPRRQLDGSIMYWLNPHEQELNNFGWVTLQDLQYWAEGKGKIPKTEAQIQKRKQG